MKVYNSPLTPDQIAIDMNQGKSLQLGGQTGNNNGTAVTGAAAEYCVPGDTSPCNPPVGEWKFDEKTGGSVNDSSGNNNLGTWYGTGTHWTRGKYGSAGQFNGSDDYVGVTHNSAQDVYPITIEAWVKFGAQLESPYPSILTKYASTSWNGYSLFVRSSDGALCTFYGRNSSNYAGSSCGSPVTGYNDNAWHYVAYTVDATGGKLYVDGKYKNGVAWFGTPQVTTTAENINIGFYSTANLTGSVDQVRIFGYARTPAQIAWDYNRGKPVGHWKFEEGEGDKAYDSSGNSNTGTLTLMDPATDWVDGKFSKALDFDGSNDVVNIGAPANLNFGNKNTISVFAWVKARNNTKNYMGVVYQGPSDGTNCMFNLGTGATDYVWRASIWHPNVSHYEFGTINLNQWDQIGFTYNGAQVKTYQNGNLITTSDATGSFGSVVAGNYIGAYNSAGTNFSYFDGQIDDVRVYNYALTDEQVKQVMNEGSVVRFAE
jgi:hypothetical protein